MPTYILTWNPERWNPEEWQRAFPVYVRQTKTGKMPEFDWSTGNRKTVQTGDRLFLFRQHTERGLIGSGYASGPSHVKPHWNESRDDLQNCVTVRWDCVVEPANVLSVAELEAANLGVPWSALLGSGVVVPEQSTARLEQLWEHHLEAIGRRGAEVKSQGRHWWVNQNQTYEAESRGGYVWSPKRNKNGARNQFYENMRELAPGDRIFSFREGYIAAVGVVQSYCYEAPKPNEFGAAGKN
jgi:hypothetical protein